VSAAKAALAGLHDIRGVQGSFLLSRPEGALLVRDALPIVSDEGLAETGRRLSNVLQAVGTVCPGADELFLRFEGMTLFTRCGERVMLGVLAADTVSLPALRMASNLVLRAVAGLNITPAATPTAAPSKLRYRGATLPPNE
jgi:hypothetical protein